VLKIFKFFDAPVSFLTLDPGCKNSDPGSGVNILDPQYWIKQVKIVQYGTVCTSYWSRYHIAAELKNDGQRGIEKDLNPSRYSN
jgi:hypothetical protein